MSNLISIETSKELDNLILEYGRVVIKFWATWCGPCRQLAPHYDKVAERRSDIVFAAADVDKSPELVERFGVMSVPLVLDINDTEVREIKARTLIPLEKEVG